MGRILVEVAYASKVRQIIVVVELDEGQCIRDAIEQAGLLPDFPDIDLTKNAVGVFGKIAALTTILHDADRVEIYRPLLRDPKELRKRRAQEQKSRA